MSEIKTYPDGSARVGEPPFPKLSPLQESQGQQDPEDDDEAGIDGADAEVKRKPGRPKAK